MVDGRKTSNGRIEPNGPSWRTLSGIPLPQKLHWHVQPAKPVLTFSFEEPNPVGWGSTAEGTASMIDTVGLRCTSVLAAAVVLSLATTTTANAACSDAAAPKVDWGGCDKIDAHLSRANLTDASLTGAYLNGVYLNGANLTKANLTSANLTGAYLIGANLTGANLTGANLTGAYLNGANLTKANLTGTKLSRAKLSGATWTDGRTCAAGSVETCD
jgi:uncharacterized protein YjbI with pentapeptide repeats